MEDPDLWREQHRFYNFLQHYDLQQYHQRFLEKGVSKVSHLKTVDEVCLEEIGLSRPERIRLMKKMEENFSLHGKLKVARPRVTIASKERFLEYLVTSNRRRLQLGRLLPH